MPPTIYGLRQTQCIYYVHIGIPSELHVLGQDSTRPFAALPVDCCVVAVSQLHTIYVVEIHRDLLM